MKHRITVLLRSLLAASLFGGYGSMAIAAADNPGPILMATGSGVGTLPEPKGPFFDITQYGAESNGSAVKNQTAINDAIAAAAAAGGGTVVVPAGDFKTYTVHLKSNVGIHFASSKSILRAAVPGTDKAAGEDGGFYDAPEPNLFVGLQDQGHSHWANSLIYGNEVENIMISGPGLIDGSSLPDPATGLVNRILLMTDPPEVTHRTQGGMATSANPAIDAPEVVKGVKAGQANKAIALKNSKNIVMSGFSMKNGGHFAIIGTGIVGWTVDGLTVDTNRDGIDIDASKNVTVRNSVFNSPTDDALVLKASFGLGATVKTENVLIENVTVSGYDAGSVLDKTYSTQELVTTDLNGPNGRIKLGTEATGGFDRVTVKNAMFDRSRGFCLETVDGAELSNVVFMDSKMKNISGSPIWVGIGDRGRAPITGISASDDINATNNVRLDNPGWILPNATATYGNYPAVRHVPSYNKTFTSAIGGGSNVSIVDPNSPTRLNQNSIKPDDPLYANALTIPIAKAWNILIKNVVVEDVDPRYPIILAGLVDNPVRNVQISHVSITYRGGLTMQHAIEQRQLDQNWPYMAYQATVNNTRHLPWLSNSWFAKNEALLPRISWDKKAHSGAGGWVNDPYNIPEMPREYPEPGIYGVMPAYGMYARHVNGLSIDNVTFKYKVEDARPAVVLDDVANAKFTAFSAQVKKGVPHFVTVTNTKKRPPVQEYVKDMPFKTTTVTNLSVPKGMAIQKVIIDRPSPGTPPDSLYALPTAPDKTHPYTYAIANTAYPKPLTVFRPEFVALGGKTVAVGKPLTFVANAKSPAGSKLKYSAKNLPAGAQYNPDTQEFSWTPKVNQTGKYTVKFIADDGVIPQSRDATITVTP